MEIEQRYAIAFCYRWNMTAEQIADVFQDLYGDKAYQLSTIYFWIRQVKSGRKNLHDQPDREKPKDEGLTNAIKNLIEKDPFLSARKMAKLLDISPNTVINRLTDDLGYKCYNTRWVPHYLNLDQKRKRVVSAKAMLETLEQQQNFGFHDVITGDESWFLYDYTQGSQWVLSKENVLTRLEKTNMQKKNL